MLANDVLTCPLVPLHPLPRLSADLPGCGGQIRTEVEDFEVEEIPLYEAAGTGDHLFLWIEKIDVAGETLRRHLARSLGIPGMDVGMAGLKDRRAVTRQWVSVPRACEPNLARIDTDRIRVLEVKPHRHKLRTAHLAGNRFRIRLRGTVDGALELAQAKLARLAVTGVPNFYGSQRMGQGGSTLAAGYALLRGMRGLCRVRTPDDTVHILQLGDRPLRRLAASALQSEVFNRTVARRMAQGLFATVLDGDVCCKVLSGGMFVTDAPDREQARFDQGEIGLTAPMWGPKSMRAARQAAELEAAVLAELGLQEGDFAALGPLAEGTRRPIRVVPQDVALEQHDDGLTVAFTLPSGSFATVFVHELVGPTAGEDAADAIADADVEDRSDEPDAGGSHGARTSDPRDARATAEPCA